MNYYSNSSSSSQKIRKSELEFFIFNFSSLSSRSSSEKKAEFIKFEFAGLVETKIKTIKPKAKTLNSYKTKLTCTVSY